MHCDYDMDQATVIQTHSGFFYHCNREVVCFCTYLYRQVLQRFTTLISHHNLLIELVGFSLGSILKLWGCMCFNMVSDYSIPSTEILVNVVDLYRVSMQN